MASFDESPPKLQPIIMGKLVPGLSECSGAVGGGDSSRSRGPVCQTHFLFWEGAVARVGAEETSPPRQILDQVRIGVEIASPLLEKGEVNSILE